jgi:DNA repair exonuclease SbcCD ATPase subunit
MIFVLITFLTAFLIEGLGTIVSVIGLSTLFGANPIIISLAVALDMGKLVVVSLLYKYWKQMGYVMKGYALVASFVTMLITSAGAAGYLTGEFQKAILGTQETTLKVDVLKQQQAKYEERKKQIDDQIASLPEKTSVNQRIRLMRQFKDEQQSLQAKIEEIDSKLPELQMQQIGVEAKAGPILYISKAFDVPVEVAVKYVVLMIIFVFDPLAVFLIIAGNFLLDSRKKSEPAAETEPESIVEPKPVEEAQDLIEDPVEPVEPVESTVLTGAEESAVEPIDPVEPAEPIVEASASETKNAEVIESPESPESPEVVTPPQNVDPVTETKPKARRSPRVAKPMVEPSAVANVERKEIRLDDLQPHRSSLHDIREQASVFFDQDIRNSAHGDFYAKNR